MSPNYDGTKIKDDPFRILQYLKVKVDKGDEPSRERAASVKEMMSETELPRGSVHNYLTNTLAPLKLVTVVTSIPQSGAASDKQLWAITTRGYEWVEGLDDATLPTVTTSEAIETAREAREQASNAKSVADKTSASVGELSDNLDKHHRRIESVSDGQDSLQSEISDIKNNLADIRECANDPDPSLTNDIEKIEEHLNTLDSQMKNLSEKVQTHHQELHGPHDSNAGTGLIEDIDRLDGKVTDAKVTLNDRQRQVAYIGAFAVVAVVIAFIGIIV